MATTVPTKKIPALKTARDWIQQLALKPHPEGGFFRETYRSFGQVSGAALTPSRKGPRAFSTAIYFLLKKRQVSRFHRILSDEIWHFYYGDPLRIHFLFPDGNYAFQDLGVSSRQSSFQVIVPAGVWFGASLHSGSRYALLGCTVAPGFDFSDFEMAKRKKLLREYPDNAEIVRALT